MENITNVCINLLSKCNEKCIYCFRGNYQVFPSQYIQPLIHALKLLKVKKVNFTGGEPTLHPELVDFLRSFKESGFIVSTTTNATKFYPNLLSYLDWISFSIDSLNPETLRKLGRSPIILDITNQYLEVIRNQNLKVKVKINTVLTFINANKENIRDIAENLVNKIGNLSISNFRSYFLNSFGHS
jgi:radical S-adenosyl methionine domain-containing protein 2